MGEREAAALTPHDKLIDRVAAMLWTFDGGEQVPEEHREAERQAYRNRARVLERIFNEEAPNFSSGQECPRHKWMGRVAGSDSACPWCDGSLPGVQQPDA